MAGDIEQGLRVQVSGLRELAKGLKGGEERLDLELRKRMRTMAKEVAADARAMAAGLQPRVPEAVLNTLVGRAQSASAEVKLGSNRVPYALGWEFGAAHNFPRETHRGIVRGWNQFPLWRGNKSEAGYFLYPTIRSKRAELEQDILDLIDEVLAGGD